MNYKNPFEDPNAEFWGKKVKDYKIPKRKETPLEKKAADSDIKGYVYVPKIKLYVAKERSLHNLSWGNTHKELHKKGMQMLTIRQFVDFILYLKQNPNIPNAKQILDEILTKREPSRLEWLDAYFTEDKGDFFMLYNHKHVNGILIVKNTEPLEKCLMKSCDIGLRSCNRQGLPTKEGNDIDYFGPGVDYFGPGEGHHVALFRAYSCGAYLDCNVNPEGAYLNLGVRAAFKKRK